MSLLRRRITLFLLPVLLLSVSTELYVRSLPNSYRIKKELMHDMADSVETIILGNSHVYSGLRPEMLPGCVVNLANVSQTLDIDLMLLEHYAPQCPRLRHVILVLDNSNLFDLPLYKTDEWFRCGYYRRYMHLGPYYRPRYWLEIFHFESLRGKIQKWHQERTPDCTSLGWNTDNRIKAKNFEEWQTTQVQRVIARHTCSDWQQAQTNAATATTIAAYCQEHGLRLTLLATPVSPAYAAVIPVRQQQFLQETRQSCARYTTTHLLDFSCDTSFVDNDYFDPDHLTHEGAAHFTHLLADTFLAEEDGKEGFAK